MQEGTATRMNSCGQTHHPSAQWRRAGWAVLAAGLCLDVSTGTVAVGQCQAVPTLRSPSQSKEWAGRASWIVDVQTAPVPPPLCTAVLSPTFLRHCPGHADLLTSPVLSRAPCHQTTHPAAASTVPVELWLQPYKGGRDAGPRGSRAGHFPALRPWGAMPFPWSSPWPWQRASPLRRGRYRDG